MLGQKDCFLLGMNYPLPFFKKKLFIYFGCAGSSLLHGHFSSCGEWGLLLAVVCGLLIAVASLVVEHRL